MDRLTLCIPPPPHPSALPIHVDIVCEQQDEQRHRGGIGDCGGSLLQKPRTMAETIPLCDIRSSKPNETLRKVHAQSSAETSGLGDSLQRIHALSSTETSGYGEAGAPSPSGPVSPYASTEDVRLQTDAAAASAAAAAAGGSGYGSSRTGGRRNPPSSVWVVEKDGGSCGVDKFLAAGMNNNNGEQTAIKSRDNRRRTTTTTPSSYGGDDRRQQCLRQHQQQHSPGASGPSDEYYVDCFDDRKWQQIHEQQQTRKRSANNAADSMSSAAAEIINLRRQGRTEKYIRDIDDEEDEEEEEEEEVDGYDRNYRRYRPRFSHSERKNSTAVDGSPEGQQPGGATGGGGSDAHFLGRSTQSAWLRWSHERRASFKRKVEFLEQRQNELQRIRMSSPVRKARKESMRFVSPELEDQHLTSTGGVAAANDDDLTLAHPAFPFDIPPPAVKKPARKQDAQEETKLTLAQWNALVAFWEHDVFVRSRYVGLLFGLVAFLLIVTGLATSNWSHFDDHSLYGACHVGLWQVCSSAYDNCTLIDYDKLQIAVIGMTMFSGTFTSMALVLSIFGVCTTSLPKKIYYYHSSGEINLLCAIGCGVSLLLFPMTIEEERQASTHLFGYGYFVVIVATACLCIAAFSMCLDDLIRTLAKGACNCWNRSKV